MPSLFTFQYSREYRFLFTYLLLATALLTGGAGWMLYHNYDVPAVNAVDMSNKLKRQRQVFEEQKRYLPDLDSAHRAVATYRPEVTAVFLEADIENQISIIRRRYTEHDTITFFRAFDQAANFYQMIYHDKKILSGKKNNVQLFAKLLEKCTIGFQATAPAGTASPTVAPATPLPLVR